MAKSKYTIVSGKHTKEDGTFVRQGETLEMEEADAAKFPNKFARVMVEAPVEAEAVKEAPAPAAAKK